MRRISLTLLLMLAFPALAAGAAKDTKLALVAYSTPREAYGQLISAFQKTAAGKGVSFSQSYGASGEQSRAVAAGLDADIVAFSLAPDVSSSTRSSSRRTGTRTSTAGSSRSPSSSSSCATATRSTSGRGTTSRSPASRS